MPSEAYAAITADLAKLGGQRVWSLLVTVFGDLAQDKGAVIDGPVLSAIMGAMDIRPEATRVALHRLRNDGWIASHKSGRTSRHGLTDHGRTQSAAASPRIYADPPDPARQWKLVMLQDGDPEARDEMQRRGFAPLSPRVFVGGTEAKAPKDALCLPGDGVPVWLRREVAPPDLAAEYAQLHRLLVRTEASLPADSPLTSLEQAVLRCLIVHNWRRLVLKHPDLPPGLYPDDWQGPACHRLVAQLLARFPRPALAQLTTT